MVLAARDALVRELVGEGMLELPRRRRSATAIGLSGQKYEVWVERPPERIRVSDLQLNDNAPGIITLADGRKLRVTLVGMARQANADADAGVAEVEVHLDPRHIAGMTPAEIRSRIELLPTACTWTAHWSDAELEAQAQEQAQQQALDLLDAVPPGFELPPGVHGRAAQESVLHFEVKRILAEVAEIAAPGMSVTASGCDYWGRAVTLRGELPPMRLPLADVELETRLGRLIPDVRATTRTGEGRAPELLLIEVTVFNPIDELRISRIRAHRTAALEVDLSRTGGCLNREQLRELVVEELEIKKWLWHPLESARQAELLSELEARREQARQAAVAKAAVEASLRREREVAAARQVETVKSAGLERVLEEYRRVAVEMFDAEVQSEAVLDREPEAWDRLVRSREQMAFIVQVLAELGYPEAGSEVVLGRRGLMAKLLTIQLDRVVGYRYDRPFEVLNAVRQAKGHQRSNWSVVLYAARAFRPASSASQHQFLKAWEMEVAHSLQAGEEHFKRDPVYDRLLSALFPDLAPFLGRPSAKQIHLSPWRLGNFREADRYGVPERELCAFLVDQPLLSLTGGPVVDTPTDAWWLRGRDLEQWTREKAGRPVWWSRR